MDLLIRSSPCFSRAFCPGMVSLKRLVVRRGISALRARARVPEWLLILISLWPKIHPAAKGVWQKSEEKVTETSKSDQKVTKKVIKLLLRRKFCRPPILRHPENGPFGTLSWAQNSPDKCVPFCVLSQKMRQINCFGGSNFFCVGIDKAPSCE